MKFCIPKVYGRGAGLGNELFPWAKAFIAGQELGARVLQPAWGLNRRPYYRYFGTSRVDWLLHRTLGTVLPAYAFTESDYRATGETDYGRAMRKFAEKTGLMHRKAWVLFTEGMWGGYHALRSARPFVLGALQRGRGVDDNLYDLAQRQIADHLVVAVHVRLGDFAQADREMTYRGRFNVAVPLHWYRQVCRHLASDLDGKVTFELFSDGSPAALAPFVEEFQPLTTWHQSDTVCSDLLAMAQADALVCSLSSFSLWAAFLSERPYLWFEPQLQVHGRHRSLWGHEPGQQGPDGVTARCLAEALRGGINSLPRGMPVGPDGSLPDPLITHLRTLQKLKAPATDLVAYGVAAANLPDKRCHAMESVP